jgi:hypothetical protein
MRPLEEVLREYLRVLEQHGSPTPKVIAKLAAEAEWNALPAEVTPFDDLKTYFKHVNGYGNAAAPGVLIQPELAWQMSALSLPESLREHESLAGTAEDPDHWPRGFLPVLADGGGSYVVVNCLAGSPTYGAVYDADESVGCCRVANSLADFFQAATQEVRQGLRRYLPDGSSLTTREYLDDAAPLYGETPFFVRKKFDEPVVDWRDGAAPKLPKKRGRRIPPAKPPNANAVRWAEIAGVPPPTDMGHYTLKMSTAPVEHWYFSQSRLKPDTATLEAQIQYDKWSVKLTRKDSLYWAQWSDGQPVSVNSTQMKYSVMTRWPALAAIEDFPKLVKQLETVLGIRFLPYVDLGFPEDESRRILTTPRLREWLAPCATQVDRYIGSR